MVPRGSRFAGSVVGIVVCPPLGERFDFLQQIDIFGLELLVLSH